MPMDSETSLPAKVVAEKAKTSDGYWRGEIEDKEVEVVPGWWIMDGRNLEQVTAWPTG